MPSTGAPTDLTRTVPARPRRPNRPFRHGSQRALGGRSMQHRVGLGVFALAAVRMPAATTVSGDPGAKLGIEHAEWTLSGVIDPGSIDNATTVLGTALPSKPASFTGGYSRGLRDIGRPLSLVSVTRRRAAIATFCGEKSAALSWPWRCAESNGGTRTRSAPPRSSRMPILSHE